AFFDSNESKFLSERTRTLRRLLVNRSPIMPTGLLLFALEYATTGTADAGILGAVRAAFGALEETNKGLYEALKQQYDFRNEYIAHEKREPLRSVEAAR